MTRTPCNRPPRRPVCLLIAAAIGSGAAACPLVHSDPVTRQCSKDRDCFVHASEYCDKPEPGGTAVTGTCRSKQDGSVPDAGPDLPPLELGPDARPEDGKARDGGRNSDGAPDAPSREAAAGG